MQNDFGAKGGMFDRAGIDISSIRSDVEPTRCVIAAARQARIPIVYLKMAFNSDLSDSNGFFDTGTWRVEGSKLCAKWQRREGGCQEVRIAGDTLWLQYKDGKWASMALVKDRNHKAGADARVG